MADRRQTLNEAADRIDVIDLAGAIIANPERNACSASAAGVLALAHAVEAFWEIALEGELLARAASLPKEEADLRCFSIELQSAHVLALMEKLRKTEGEDQ